MFIRRGLFQIDLAAVFDGFFHRMDLACGLKRHLGQQRADQLVDEDREQRNVADELAFRAELHRCDAHTERDTGLRQERDAEVFADLRLAFHELRRIMCTQILAERTRNDIHHADEHDRAIFEHAEIELRAGDDEKRRKQRARPPVCFGHDLFRQRAEVAEDRAEHHARQKRRKTDGHGADRNFRHRQRRNKEYQRDGHVQTVRVGVEQRFELCEHPAADRAQSQRADDLQKRVDHDRNEVKRVRVERLCNAEGDGEHDQAHRVVQCDDRQQQVHQRALGLVLPDDHQGSCRSRRCGNCAEGDGLGNGQLAVCKENDRDQRDIHKERRGQRLQNADDKRLLAGFFEVGKTELAADRKRDKAERDVRDQRQL